MRGHAAANLMPLVASNRIGEEAQGGRKVTFCGSSFVAGPTGEILAKGSRDQEDIVLATIDFDRCAELRREWGLFRDRRPALYGRLNAL